jgi:hypothetical protein
VVMRKSPQVAIEKSPLVGKGAVAFDVSQMPALMSEAEECEVWNGTLVSDSGLPSARQVGLPEYHARLARTILSATGPSGWRAHEMGSERAKSPQVSLGGSRLIR